MESCKRFFCVYVRASSVSGVLGLVRTTDQPSRLCNQSCLSGQAHLHNRPTALARWVETSPVPYSLLVRRIDGHREVVHMDRTGFLGVCTFG